MSDGNAHPILYVIAIHGTFAGKANLSPGSTDENEFYAHTSDFAQTLIQNLSKHYDVNWQDFQWSGENLQSERQNASKELWRGLNGANIPDTANILVIAHSHGGNVAFEWLAHLKHSPRSGLISLGTPYVHLEDRRIFAKLAYYLRNIITIFAIPGFFTLFLLESSSIRLLYTFWLVFFILACIGVYQVSKTERQRRKQRLSMQDEKVVAICHPDDEAVAILQSETTIPVSDDMVFQPIASLGFPIMIVVWAAFFVSGLIHQDIPFVADIIVPKPFNYILILSLSAIMSAMSVSIILQLMKLIARIIRKVFNKGIGTAASNLLSSALVKVGKGEDNKNPIIMKMEPQCPDDIFTMIDGTHDAISKAFDRTYDLASENIVKHKSAFISELLKQGGDLFSVLENHPEIAQSLIHCNYFTTEMAEFIGDRVPDWFGDKYTGSLEGPAE